MDGRAVQIVDFDEKSTKARLDVDAVNDIIEKGGIKHLPTIVISIGGVARSGKSFLLNLFVSYLAYIEENGTDSGWERSASPIKGVNWAQSKTAVTLGIWIWNRPYIITRPDGSKAAVLLLDTQGTGDNRRSDVKLDTLIMYISLQVSSVQVLNIARYLTSNEMTGLQLCADYADVGQTDSGDDDDDYLFQSLVFVIRDYQSGDEFGEDKKLFRDIVRECENDDLKKVVLGIKNAFKSITTYNMPYPGNKIATASSTKAWSVKDVPEEFLEPAKELIERLCQLQNSRGDTVQCWSSGHELVDNFRMLKYHLENDELPQIATPAEALQETIVYRAYNSTLKIFADSISKLSNPEVLKAMENEDQLKLTFDKEKKVAMERFKKAGKANKYGKSQIWRKYQEMWETAFETSYASLQVQFTFIMQVKKLERENELVKIQVEEQATQFTTEIGGLHEQIDQSRRSQKEAEERAKANEESFRSRIEDLQQQVEEANNDEEKEMLRQMIAKNQEEAEKMRKDQEKAMEAHREDMKSLSQKMVEMQEANEKKIIEEREKSNQLIQEMREEAARRQREAEQLRNKQSSNPFTAILSTIAGGIGGFMAGGPMGAALGATAGLTGGLNQPDK